MLQQGSPPPAPPPLEPGDHAPWFIARSDTRPDFGFSSLGGRRTVLSFLGSFSDPASSVAFRDLLDGAGRFGRFVSALLLVTSDPADAGARAPANADGVRFLFDESRTIAALFGHGAGQRGRPVSFLIDERLRILAVVSTRDPAEHAAQVYALFDRLRPLPAAAPAALQAPVLIVPRVFEPALCAHLVAGYQAHGGADSGFMVEREGRTVAVIDHERKRRADWLIEDERLVAACRARIQRRIVPEVRRAFQFEATRVERDLVACYDGETGGHFKPHRDNTTKGTAHRRFAVSINLNAGAYDGGDLVFPEFGRALFRPPTGGACVFSCSLLHEATPVTRGTRYVFVPFLYDDAGSAVREQNAQYLAL
ncbi:MAG: 2OG-Fe(II) oxygenase [Hyphomonadaceae bacterium]|nr:2OG-Fe(II) oxygenase [Hyphomonadaceae bacterium]